MTFDDGGEVDDKVHRPFVADDSGGITHQASSSSAPNGQENTPTTGSTTRPQGTRHCKSTSVFSGVDEAMRIVKILVRRSLQQRDRGPNSSN